MKQACACGDMSHMQPQFKAILTARQANLCVSVRFLVAKNRRVRYMRSRK